MPSKTSRTNADSRCPGCQTKLSGATDPTFGAAPKANDLSVCAYCGLYLVFNTDLTVRSLRLDELNGLPEDERSLLDAYKALVTKCRP